VHIVRTDLQTLSCKSLENASGITNCYEPDSQGVWVRVPLVARFFYSQRRQVGPIQLSSNGYYRISSALSEIKRPGPGPEYGHSYPRRTCRSLHIYSTIRHFGQVLKELESVKREGCISRHTGAYCILWNTCKTPRNVMSIPEHHGGCCGSCCNVFFNAYRSGLACDERRSCLRLWDESCFCCVA
jgi:hypothetical protein